MENERNKVADEAEVLEALSRILRREESEDSVIKLREETRTTEDGGKVMALAASAYDGIAAASERGMSDVGALFVGSLQAAFEAYLEKKGTLKSLADLQDIPITDIKDLAKVLIASPTSEALEEALTEVGQKGIDLIVAAISGDVSTSEYGATFEKYRNNVESVGDAFLHTIQEAAIDVGLSALGGFISGAEMSGPLGVLNYASNRSLSNVKQYYLNSDGKLDTEKYNDLITRAYKSKNDSIVEYAKKLAEKRDGVKASEAALLHVLLETEQLAAGMDGAESATFDIASSPSTSIQFASAESYTPAKRKTIKEYLTAVNTELAGFIQRVKNGEKTRPWFALGKVSSRTSTDVKRLTGIDVSEYEHGITPDDVRHIVRRHGENGEADKSMRDNNDTARIQFVLENYDTVELLNDTTTAIASSDGSPAQKVKFSKTINGTYYVVEAVPDSQKKKMRIISAYISAKEASPEHSNIIEPEDITSETQLPYNADTNSIPQLAEESQYTIREALSDIAKGAFDIAMEDATDKDAVATQFRIKYLEGKTGSEFTVDNDSELTPSMQEAAYKYGAEAAKVEESTSKVRELFSADGKKVFDSAISKANDKVTAAKQFDNIYLSGFERKTFTVDNNSELTPAMQREAYKAGEAAKASLGTVTVSKGAKVTNEFVARAADVAKSLGAHIVIDAHGAVENGMKDRGSLTKYSELHIAADAEVDLYNADGTKRTLKGEDAAMMIILGHEATHRLQQLDKKTYNAFRSFVLTHEANAVQRYMSAYGYSYSTAVDEVVSDYAMTRLFSDKKVIKEVTKKHSRVAQVIRDFLEWIKTKLGIKSTEIDTAIRLWNDAYNASVRNAKSDANINAIAQNKNTADSGVKYSKTKRFTKNSNIDESGKVKYNSSIKWVYDAGLFDGAQSRKFYAAVADIQKRGHKFYQKARNGDKIVEVDNMLVYFYNGYQNPKIRKIIKFDTNLKYEIWGAREILYDFERGQYSWFDALQIIESVYGKEFVSEYEAETFSTSQGQTRQGEGKDSGETVQVSGILEDGRGNDSESGENSNLTTEADFDESAFSSPKKSVTGTENILFESETKNTADGDVKWSRTNIEPIITVEDIANLQAIGEKSINDFTSAEITKSEKWAQKFYSELGTKSPFFRAWFGDWREYDISEVKIKNPKQLDLPSKSDAELYIKRGLKDKSLFRGNVQNEDTGFTINIGAQVYNDTLTYALRRFSREGDTNHLVNEISVLSEIKGIIEKAIYLNSNTLKENESNPYRSFIHHFYSMLDVGGERYLIKLTVDELNPNGKTVHRAYNIKNIKISHVAVSRGLLSPASTTGDSGETFSTYSISDLFAVVKKYDSEFKPKTVVKELLNEDGTPKVFYHGTTNQETVSKWNDKTKTFDNEYSKFYTFKKSYDEQVGHFFTDDENNAGGYGSTVYQVYLRCNNPLVIECNGANYSYITHNGQSMDTYEWAEWAKKNRYDGVIFKQISDGAGYGDLSSPTNECVVFYSKQIKSVDENIGTFDGGNPDIRYSKTGTENILFESETKNTAEGGVKYSSGTTSTGVIDLSKDNKLSAMVDGIYGSKRYSIIKNYILDELKDQPITLSDGKKAVVDNRDAQHIAAHKSSSKEAAEISRIKEIVERAKLVAEENSTKDRKFDYFWYYEASVKFGKETFPIYVNVGRAKNDSSYHIYDLTKKIRDTAHRVYGVERPVGNALLNDISIDMVPQDSDGVKSDLSQKSTNGTKKSVTGTEDILFESEAEKAQYVADSFDLSGAENFKAAGSMERMSNIANSIAKAHRVGKEGRVKLAHALEKGVQNMRKASLTASKNQPLVHSPTVFADANTKAQDSQGKSDDAKVKQTAAEGFLEAAMVISPDADVKAQVEISNALAESVWAEMTTDRLPDTIRSIRDDAIKAARAEVRADRLAALGEKYGTIKPGERPSRVVTLPKKTSEGKKVSQTVRTVMEAEATPDEMLPTIEQMVADGEFSYEAITDKGAVAKAEDRITKNGFDATVREWFKSVGSGKVSKDNTALGWTIYNNAANSGDSDLAIEVLCEMVKHQRNAAQALQATRILKKLSPSGQLYAAQKSVQGLQEELEERYGDKAPELKIDPKLAEEVLNADTEEKREEALADLYRDIGRQMPSSVMDKWNAWRYLSMLGNARTHIRNIVGNAGFAPVVAAKNITATGIESLVSFASRGKISRTKAFVGVGKADRALLAAAWTDYDAVADAALGQSKYNDNQFANKHIEEGKRVFKFKPLEAARRGNSWLLDKEDSWFSKPQYANALAQYCKVNGITAEQIKSGKDLEKARAYAIKEAQKATYRDTNAFSELFSKLGRIDERGEFKTAKRIWNRGVEGVLPFRKTPANILARGIEYSPIGLGVGVKNLLLDVKSGKVTAAEAIDKMSAGLTGTGLMVLGAFLASQGYIRGFGGDDDKEKEYMELMGHQQYALEIGNTSVTLDWLAPEALPFFVGANIAEQAMQAGEMTVEGLISALGSISDPMLSMSCLQGLNDLIESVSFSDTSGIVTIAASAATSYLTQGIPTLFGQIERTSESERMMTYTSKGNKMLTPDMQYTVGKVSAKLPGDYSQIPYIDAWGRTESSGSVGERAFNNMLNPSYTSTVSESPMEKELLRLYDQTGEPVLPSRADKSFPIDGEQVYLTAEQYQKYATSKGKRSYRILTSLTKSEVYNSLDDFTKAEIVSKVYTYCNAIAKSGCGAKNNAGKGYALDGWVSKAYDACSKYGIDEATYIAAYIMAGHAGKYVNDGETIDNSPGLCIMQAVYSIPGLSQEQYDAMFVNFGVGSKVRGYDKKTVESKIAEFNKKYERIEG